MHNAAVLPSADIGYDTVAVKDWVQAAEELGYDLIIAYDHVLGAEHSDRALPLTGPYTTEDPFREPLTLFAYLAGLTRAIHFMSGVMVLPQRQTALVAKQTAEVQLLSGGRLTLGVGVGWNYVEYESLGVEFAARGARLDEQIEVMRLLWTQPVVNFKGKFHRIDRAGIAPRPSVPIPIWFGGRSARAISRAARIGDGFFFTSVDDEVCKLVDDLRMLSSDREGADGGKGTFGLAAQVKTALGDAQLEEDVARWTMVGGTHIAVDTMVPRRNGVLERLSVDEHVAALRNVSELIEASVPA